MAAAEAGAVVAADTQACLQRREAEAPLHMCCRSIPLVSVILRVGGVLVLHLKCRSRSITNLIGCPPANEFLMVAKSPLHYLFQFTAASSDYLTPR